MTEVRARSSSIMIRVESGHWRHEEVQDNVDVECCCDVVAVMLTEVHIRRLPLKATTTSRPFSN